MTEFDYTCLGIIAISGLLGLMRGFLKEAFSLIAYAAAFIGAIWWGPAVYPWFMQYISNALISMGIGYAVIFIAILLVVGLVNVTLATLIDATGLGPADQGLGILFGIARGVMIILILVVLAGYTPFPKEPWWVNARFSPMAVMAVHEIKIRLPDSIGSFLPY